MVRALALLLALGPAVALACDADEDQAVARRFDPYAGRKIGGVAIDCDIEMCTGLKQAERLRKVTRLQRGRPLRPEEVGCARSHLMRTGYFRTVDIEPLERGEEVYVKVTGVGSVIITELEIGYGDWSSRMYPKQFIPEIRKRLTLKKGGSFPPLNAEGGYDPADQAFIDDQARQVERLYAQQGYEDTAVRILAEYHGHNDKQVRVLVVVSEGVQPHLGQVLVRGNDAYPYSKVVSHLTTGERFDFWRELFGTFGVGRYDRRRLKEELEEVAARYREDGYVAVRVRAEGVVTRKDVVFPLVRIHEGPKLEVEIEGNRSLSDEDLRGVLTFGESGAFDEQEVEASRQAIVEAYQAVARYFARVEADPPRVSRERVAVRFRVTEGPRVYVRRVEIEGNSRISDEDLFNAMETRGIAEDGVLSAFGTSAGVLQDARVANDLTAIRRLYHDRGMPNVRFRCADPREEVDVWSSLRALRERRGHQIDPRLFHGKFDVWSDDPVANRCFLVLPDEEDARLVVLRLELDEGLQSTVRRLDVKHFIDGMDVRMQDEFYVLLQSLGFMDELRRWNKRAPLNRAKLDAVRGFLLRYYHQSGFLQADVQPVCLGEDEGVALKDDCTEALLYGRHLEQVGFSVVEGPRTRVDGVLIRGNLQTRDHIIANELLFDTGAPLGTQGLFLSQANLRSLGVFESVSVETIGGGEDRADWRDTTVLVTVEEGRYQLIETTLGLNLDSARLSEGNFPLLYAVGASIRDRNFLGRAYELGFGFSHANRIDAPQDVAGDDATWVAGPFFRDRRLFNTRLDLTLEVTALQGRTEQRDAYERSLESKATIGYDFFNLSYPSDWGQGLRAQVGIGHRVEARRELVRLGERPGYGDLNQSVGVEPSIRWDKRDNLLHPTRGWFVALSSEAQFDSATADFEPSFKETLTGQYVHSFFRRRLIVVPSLRLGAVQTDRTEDELTSGFLFKAGGDGVALPVRGYLDASIDACGGKASPGPCANVYDPDDLEQLNPRTIGGEAMVLGSLELRFPTFIVDDFWFAAFTDVGAVAPEWGDMDIDRFYPSVGLGLRWLVTGQIPLRLDLGIPLRETAFGPQEPRFHLNIFYTL